MDEEALAHLQIALINHGLHFVLDELVRERQAQVGLKDLSFEEVATSSRRGSGGCVASQ